MASEKSASVRGARFAGGDEEEMEPLLSKHGHDGEASVTDTYTSTSVSRTEKGEDASEAAWAKITRIFIRVFAVLSSVLAVVGLIAGLYLARDWLKQKWIERFPPKCVLADWADWSHCSATCGLGTQRTRRTFGPDVCAPKPKVASLHKEKACELVECGGRDCHVSDWGEWSPQPCSEPCGPGEQTRLRRVLAKPDATGRPCPVLYQRAFCEVQKCARECRLSAWSSWSRCSMTCGVGHMKRTRSSLLTVSNGICPHLQETAPCEVAPCPTHCTFALAPSIPNSKKETVQVCNGTKALHSCSFECEEGFEPDGPLICNQGIFIPNWCFPRICREVPKIEHAVRLRGCRDYPSGSSCRLMCRPGYRKTGDLLCDHGKFSNSTCLEATCTEVPRIAHSTGPGGVPECNEISAGHRCDNFTCVEGYMKSKELVCEDVNFNRPRCREAYCDSAPPRVRNSSDVVDRCALLIKEGLPIPSRKGCDPNCQPGFRKSRDTLCVRGEWLPARCLPEDDTCWGQPAGCSETCSGSSTPSISNVRPFTCRDATSGETCAVQCSAGHDFLEHDRLYCAAGEWQGVECLPTGCLSKPILEHGADLSACAGSADGERCVVKCLPGYEPSKPFLVCSLGIWRGASCVPTPCEEPAVPRHAVGDYSGCRGLLPGDWCPLHCEDGFSPNPPEGFRCYHGGRFDRALCEPHVCAKVPLVLNSGDLSACAGATSGSHCEVSCEKGFVKVGDLFCNSGVWTQARCRAVESCERVPTIPYAEKSIFECIDTPVGRSCGGFRCHPGFDPVGGLDCEMGEFSLPRCLEARCAQALPVQYSLLKPDECRDMESGGVCPLQCQEGYSKTGDLLCDRGTFNAASCMGPVEQLNADLEALSLELRLGVTFAAWSQRTRGSTLAAHLVRALADAAGVAPGRVIDRGARPLTEGSSVVDVDLLPAELPDGVSARAGLDRAQEALRSPASRLVGLLGPEAARGASLAVARSTIGKLCTSVPVINHADNLAFCVYTLSGGECPLVCHVGFAPTGNLVCLDGRWNQPECVGAPCQAAPVVENAGDLGRCRGTSTGGTCPLECRAGYVPKGELECREGSFTEAKCAPKACAYPPRMRLGSPEEHTQCLGMVSGQACNFRCIPGFFPTGEGLMRCELGNWHRRGSCEAAGCFYAPVVLHAGTDLSACAGSEHGEECPFACEEGYEKVGGALTCLFGQFEGARCEALGCATAPDVPGLRKEFAANCAPAKSGDACQPDCGLDRKLSAPLICSYGRWSKSACVSATTPMKSCEYAPNIPRSMDVAMCVGTKPDMECKVKCYPGYELDADLLCGNGTWNPVACEPKSCERPIIPHSTGLTECMGLTHGSLCMLRCLPGYAPGGLPTFVPGKMDALNLTTTVIASSIECHAGEWRGPGCEEAPCDSEPPGVQNAEDLSSCAGTPSRKTCRLRCKSGFYAVGFPECVRGVWRSMDLARCEEAPCTDYPDIANARDTSSCLNRASGQECLLSCDEGFEPTGTLRCFRGVWLLARCVARCQAPPGGISNAADLAHCAGTEVGDFCPLVCTLGFRSSGDLKCLEGRRWEASFCYDVSEALSHAAVANFTIAGLSAPRPEDTELAANSFHRTLAHFLHVAPDLVSVELNALRRAGAAQADAFRLELRVLCSDCASPLRRADALAAGGGSSDSGSALEEKLRNEFCGERCPPQEGTACMHQCLQEQASLAVSADGKAHIASVDLTGVGRSVEAEAEKAEHEDQKGGRLLRERLI